MTKCRQITSGEVATPDCGKDICCVECEKKAECENACDSVKSGEVKEPGDCKDAISDETALATMKAESAAIIEAIANLTVQKKQIEDREKEMREKLIEAMETYGVKKFDTPLVTFTYVAPTTRNTIDSTKLKKELPDVAAKYTKTSNVKASVKIEVK